MILENLPSMSLMQFFSINLDCHFIAKSKNPHTKKYCFPSMSEYIKETEFAKFFMGWNLNGLKVHVEVKQGFEACFYADYQRGDSLEVFIDTRDSKDKSNIGQFCHHFVFYPEKIQSVFGREVTRFRSDDVHSLCNPKKLIVEPSFGKKFYILDIEIPASCLHGFDPTSFNRLGFCYRINRFGTDPQHFALVSSEYKIEQSPFLWPSLSLVQEANS